MDSALPNEPELKNRLARPNLLPPCNIRSQFREANSGSFRRNTCFGALFGSIVLARQAPPSPRSLKVGRLALEVESSLTQSTSPTTPCPAKLLINDTQMKSIPARTSRSVPFEILHRAFVFLRGAAGTECPKIPPLPRLRVLLARVQAKLTRFEFSYHEGNLTQRDRTANRPITRAPASKTGQH
jgi:hypothetical protein